MNQSDDEDDNKNQTNIKQGDLKINKNEQEKDDFLVSDEEVDDDSASASANSAKQSDAGSQLDEDDRDLIHDNHKRKRLLKKTGQPDPAAKLAKKEEESDLDDEDDDDERNIRDDDLADQLGTEHLSKAYDVFGEDVFSKNKDDAPGDENMRTRVTGDNYFEPKSLREVDDQGKLVAESEIPERILYKYKLNALKISEVNKHSYVNQNEDDIKVATEFIWNRIKQMQLPILQKKDVDTNLHVFRIPPDTYKIEIKHLLKLFRIHFLEPPFIFRQRKTEFNSEIDEDFIWKVWQIEDEQIELRDKKVTLQQEIDQIQMKKKEDPIVTEYLRNSSTLSQLEDINMYISNLKPNQSNDMSKIKLIVDQARKNNLDDFIYNACITPEEFAMNIIECKKDPDMYAPKFLKGEQSDSIKKVCFEQINEVQDKEIAIITAVIYTAAKDLSSHPLIRSQAREIYMENCQVFTEKTEKGNNELNIQHPYYQVSKLGGKEGEHYQGKKILTFSSGHYTYQSDENVPQEEILNLNRPEMWQDIRRAVEKDYIHMQLGTTEQIQVQLDKKLDSKKPNDMKVDPVIREFLKFQLADSGVVDMADSTGKEWDALRLQILKRTFWVQLYNEFKQEVMSWLDAQAQDAVFAKCESKFNQMCNEISEHRPTEYHNKQAFNVNEMHKDQNNPESKQQNCVMALVGNYDTSTVTLSAAIVCERDKHKEEEVFKKSHVFKFLLHRSNPENTAVHNMVHNEKMELKNTINNYNIKTIIIGADNPKMKITQDRLNAIKTDFSLNVNIIQGDMDLPRSYSVLDIATKTYPTLTVDLRKAICLARCVHHKLAEVAYVQLHAYRQNVLHGEISTKVANQFSLTKQLSQLDLDRLDKRLECVLVKRVSEIGVNVNQARNSKYYSSLVSFLPGLGFRKAEQFFDDLRMYQSQNFIYKRKNLLKFNDNADAKSLSKGVLQSNCIGNVVLPFFYILQFGKSSLNLQNFMDSSRIHTIEMKEFANTVLKSACSNSSVTYVKDKETEIQYKSLSHAQFENMDMQNYKDHLKNKYNKDYTNNLDFIVSELKYPFKVCNKFINELTGLSLFYKLTGESPESFYEGVTTQVKIVGIMKSEKQSGLRVATDSGIEGKIDIKDIKDIGNDENMLSPDDLASIAKIGMYINVRVKSIKTDDKKAVSVFFSSKISDLSTRNLVMSKKVEKLDPSFCQEDEDMLNQGDEKQNEYKEKYTTRSLVHPSFKNVTYRKCIQDLENRDPGSQMFRPSGIPAPSHAHIQQIALTVKQSKGIQINYKIEEEITNGKKNYKIFDTQQESINEIIAMFVSPLANYITDLTEHKNFKDGGKESLEKQLIDTKKANNDIVPQGITFSLDSPHFALLGYILRETNIVWELIKITPKGQSFHHYNHNSVNTLIGWFKKYCGTATYMKYAKQKVQKVYEFYNRQSGNLGAQEIKVVKTKEEDQDMDSSLPKSEVKVEKKEKKKFIDANINANANLISNWNSDDLVNKSTNKLISNWDDDDMDGANMFSGANWGGAGAGASQGQSQNNINSNNFNSGRPERKFDNKDRPKGCFNCGEEGHYKADCPNPHKPREQTYNREPRENRDNKWGSNDNKGGGGGWGN